MKFLLTRGINANIKKQQLPPFRKLLLINKRTLTTKPRKDRFKQLTSTDIQNFKQIIGENGVIHDQNYKSQSLQVYNNDWMNKYHGKSTCVLRPKTTNEVSKLLKYCNENLIAVVPQGGNTGLVGGSVSVYDEVVLQLGRMNEIRHFDHDSGIVVCDAGVVLENLDNWLHDKGYMCPLDLGAKGSCQIGGNAATNAGGLRLLRYGSLHGTIVGMEAVLPDGTILDNLVTLRKDNTGLDLKQLFIGSEGSLGVITGLSILTPKKPNSVNVAMMAVPSYESVLKAFSAAKEDLSEILSAFEFFDSSAKNLVFQHRKMRDPLQSESPFFCLIETQGSNGDHDAEKIEKYLTRLLEEEIALDGTLAQDEQQGKDMWAVREGIPEACSKEGAVYKYDISLPLPKLYQLVTDMQQRFKERGLFGCDKSIVTNVVGYGHVGDGNLHLNISATKYDDNVSKTIEPFVYEFASKVRGSISAEHGLGLMKGEYIEYSKSKDMVEWMKKVKTLFDPNGIMNPYKYLE